MSDNVTQVEGLDFTVQDHATAPADRMAKSFEHVHHAAEGATRKLSEMTHHAAMSGLAMVGLGFGLREVANKAGEANLELENSAKKIAGVQYTFGGWKKGTTGQEKWNESLQTGTEIVAKLEESEGKLKMTRGELADIYKSTYALGARHNLNQEQQIDLTEKFGAVQKVLGVNAEFAAMQVYRMAMTGKARGFDDFSKKMKESVGDLKAFGKLSEEKRFQKLKAAMGDLMPAAEGMGKGIAGSMFDVRESIDELTRDLTGPVFKEVTKDFSEWAHELGKVREGGQSAAAEWGGKLVTAFGYLKDATAFIADHWKTIAGIFVATKFTGAMQGLAGRFGASAAAGGAGGAAGVMNVSAATVNVSGGAAAALGGTTAAALGNQLKPSLTSTIGKLAGFAAKVGMAGEALGAYSGILAMAWKLGEHIGDRLAEPSHYGAGSALAGGLGSKTAETLQSFRELVDKERELGRSNTETSVKAKEAYANLRGAYGVDVIGKGGKVNIDAAKAAYGEMDVATRERQLAGLGLDTKKAYYNTNEERQDFASRLAEVIGQLISQGAGGTPTKNGRALAGKAVTNINVAHLEITQDFKQADPDRVFHNVPRDIVDMVNSPRASGVAAVAG